MRFAGSMGDPTGVMRYKEIDTSTIDKWKGALATPFRQFWIGKYFRWLKANNINIGQYELQEPNISFERIAKSPLQTFLDMANACYGVLDTVFEANQLRLYGKKGLSRNMFIRHY